MIFVGSIALMGENFAGQIHFIRIHKKKSKSNRFKKKKNPPSVIASLPHKLGQTFSYVSKGAFGNFSIQKLF